MVKNKNLPDYGDNAILVNRAKAWNIASNLLLAIYNALTCPNYEVLPLYSGLFNTFDI